MQTCPVLGRQAVPPRAGVGLRLQADRSVAYASKLDDFESFVAHAKLATLALVPASAAAGDRRDASEQGQQVCPGVM